MYIQVKALGKVERDPELHIIEGGTPITNFSLAVDTKRCREDITIWLNCTAWGGLAETVERYVTKGSMILVEGDFTSNQYTKEDGKQGVSLEVTIVKFSFADGSKPGGNVQQSGTGLDDPYCAY
jgi:single-strand DNA-binding protein